MIIVGRTVDELSRAPGAVEVTSIATRSPSGCGGCFASVNANAMNLILAVTSAALLVPMLIFIGTATRLAAARREQRFAAMRLVGATPRQISVVSAIESTVAAVAGTAVGFGMFLLLRVPLAAVPFTGEPFFPSDLSLGPIDGALVAIGVPLAAAGAAWIALRRVRLSPLGVSRRVTPGPPRAYRLIPLVAGIGELAYFVGRRPDSTSGQLQAYLAGVLLMMAGLLFAGPWLTMAASRVMARLTNRPATLIAARRLADDPRAGFRAISGLILALFVTSTAVGVMTTFVAERGGAGSGDAAAEQTLVVDFSHRWVPNSGAPAGSVAPVPDSVLAGLHSIPGVQGVTVIHTNPLGTEVPIGSLQMRAGLVSCEQFAGVSGFGHCAAGADAASVPPHFAASGESASSWKTTVWPTAAISSEQLRSLPVQEIVVGTDGSKSTIERARLALAAAIPYQQSPATVAEFRASSGPAQELAGYQQLVNVVILVSLCVAGCSLAVSVVAGLNDRKRPFSLLRLTGARLGTLRRIVVLESTVPLLVTAVVATGSGFLAAQLFLWSQLDYSLRPPAAAYYLAVLAGLAVSLGVIALTLPLLSRITGPETARNE